MLRGWQKEGVYSALPEMIYPAHAALIVVDMQNDFCAKGGLFDRSGKDLSAAQAIVPRLQRLVQGARDAGVMVVYLQNINLRDGASSSAAELSRRALFGIDSDVTLDGTWGAEIIPELRPLLGEVVVRKHRPSGFIATDLDLILRANAIETIITTGVVTNGCVYSTAWVGVFLGYYSVMAEDCVASWRRDLHEATLLLARNALHSVTTSENILQVWKSLKVKAPTPAQARV